MGGWWFGCACHGNPWLDGSYQLAAACRRAYVSQAPVTYDTMNCSESTAGSFHLSTTNSQQRLRAVQYVHPAKTLYVPPPVALHPHEQPFLGITAFLRHALFPAPVLPLASSRHPHARPWSMLCLKWIVILYCFLSFVVFSVDIYLHPPIIAAKDTRKDTPGSEPNIDTNDT